MTKTCKQCNTNFEITDNDLKFYDDVSPIFNGNRYQISPPKLCSFCRQQRRLAWRNERMLYDRKCDAIGQEIISVFSPDKKIHVYNNEYWFSDKWDARDYGQNYSFSHSFLGQFKELLSKVPQLARSAVGNQNSEYVNQAGWCKNCYLIFEADYSENCYYANLIYDSRFCMEGLQMHNCELCYECIDCKNCYNLTFSQSCQSCSDSKFLKNCISCKNCFGCVNLQNQEYHYLNRKYSKEEYSAKLQTIQTGSHIATQELKEQFSHMVKKYPCKNMQGIQNENSIGNYLYNTKNCSECYDLYNSQDCKFVFNCRTMKNVYDTTVFGSLKGADFCYENHEIGDGVRNVIFSDQTFSNCYNILYSKLCSMNSHDLFGCIGLRHKQYCILNRQYSKEEYESLVPRIIEKMRKDGEWGEFFPPSLSPFGYNETVAQEYYPLTKEEALSKGFNWSDFEPPPPKVEKILSTEQMKKLPDHIKDIPDDILNWALTCEVTGKPYRIIKQELQFYREHNLPIPRRHPDQRHKDRMALRNPRKLYSRTCMKCERPIQTTYAPDRPEIVYCEECYLKEVY
jgi:hypothetical protein